MVVTAQSMKQQQSPEKALASRAPQVLTQTLPLLNIHSCTEGGSFRHEKLPWPSSGFTRTFLIPPTHSAGPGCVPACSPDARLLQNSPGNWGLSSGLSQTAPATCSSLSGVPAHGLDPVNGHIKRTTVRPWLYPPFGEI